MIDTLSLIFALVCFAGLIYFQIKLSMKEKPIMGLIIPIGRFAVTVLIAGLAALLMFNTMSGAEEIIVSGGDEVLTSASDSVGIIGGADGPTAIIVSDGSSGGDNAESIYKVPALAITYALLVMNIPTLIYLAIYFVCRFVRKKKNAVDQMAVQDL